MRRGNKTHSVVLLTTTGATKFIFTRRQCINIRKYRAPLANFDLRGLCRELMILDDPRKGGYWIAQDFAKFSLAKYMHAYDGSSICI